MCQRYAQKLIQTNLFVNIWRNLFTFVLMNNRTKKFFIAICDNEVVCLDNTLAGFHEIFKNIEPNALGYITFFRKFKNADRFTLTIKDKGYYFQRYTQ